MLAGTQETFQAVTRSLHALLYGLIDYAGMYPPAGLSLADAMSHYAAYQNGERSFALGRFVIGADKLDQFAQSHAQHNCLWPLAVVAAADAVTVRKIARFHADDAEVEALELRLADREDISHVMSLAPRSATIYFELPADADLGDNLQAIHAAGARAKLRTGGVTPELIPSTTAVAHFLTACAAVPIAFKATAGLHHPIRSSRHLTYDKHSPISMMHGFMNVFVAACLAQQKASPQLLTQLLDEQDPASFSFTDSHLTWRDSTLMTEQIHAARSDFAIGFGSCSFEEPFDDMEKLGWL